MVIRECKNENVTVKIHDDFLIKEKSEIEKILKEVSSIYIRAFERELMEGVS